MKQKNKTDRTSESLAGLHLILLHRILLHKICYAQPDQARTALYASAIPFS